MEEKKENKHPTEQDLFVNLVIMLSASAMQQMGKIPDPLTGKNEVSMDGARVSIDMLDMIRNKMRGNLSAGELKILEDTISSLKLEFIRTADKAKPGDTPAKEQDMDAPEQEEKKSESAEAKERKFHKSYGDQEKEA